MQAIFRAIDWILSLKVFTGYRTKIVQICMYLLAGATTYQVAATAPDFLNTGLDLSSLPDIPLTVFAILGPLNIWFNKKFKQFISEHKPKP